MNDLVNFLKFSFIWNFHDKKKCVEVSLHTLDSLKYYCVIKTIEILSFCL